MNCDWYFTNKDCKKCCFSRVVDISSDYEAHEYQCDKKHRIEGQMDVNKKGCKLSAGEYYVAGKVSIHKTK